MKSIAKRVLGALVLAGTAAIFAAPASAGVSFGIAVGPGYYGPPAGAVCNPYSRYYNPYYCDDYDFYYGPPIWFDGAWYSGPLRSRWYGGHREFWVHDGWRYSDRYRGGGRFEHGHGDWGRGGGYGHGDWGGHGGGYGHGGWGDHGGWGGHGGHGGWGGHH